MSVTGKSRLLLRSLPSNSLISKAGIPRFSVENSNHNSSITCPISGCPLSKYQVYALLTSLTRLTTCYTADSLPCVWVVDSVNEENSSNKNDHRLAELRAALLEVYSAAVMLENATEGDNVRKVLQQRQGGVAAGNSATASKPRAGYSALVAAL
jgi:hypothetical protein